MSCVASNPNEDLGLKAPHWGSDRPVLKNCVVTVSFPSSRLPILQGGTFAFVAPSLAMLSLPTWKCPEWTLHASQVNTSSPEFIEEWQKRIREVTGHQGGGGGRCVEWRGTQWGLLCLFICSTFIVQFTSRQRPGHSDTAVDQIDKEDLVS